MLIEAQRHTPTGGRDKQAELSLVVRLVTRLTMSTGDAIPRPYAGVFILLVVGG